MEIDRRIKNVWEIENVIAIEQILLNLPDYRVPADWVELNSFVAGHTTQQLFTCVRIL